MTEEAIAHFSAEAKGKVASNQARLVLYDKIKGNLPAQMKFSPIAATPHKSKSYRLILDPSFSLKLNPHGCITSVKKQLEDGYGRPN